MMIESLLYQEKDANTIQCHTCNRLCEIKDGAWGYCRTRQNKRGKLFSYSYGEVAVYRKAPIELKPVYHYLPGQTAFSLGSVGCNFLCPGCQNWELSFSPCDDLATPTTFMSPEEIIDLAGKMHCEIVSFTYNEPTLWLEYTLDVLKLAKAADLKTNYVTNGFMTRQALDLIGRYLDIFRVDIKAFSDDGYRKIAHIDEWHRILQTVKRAKEKWQMHIEVVTNIIPGYNGNLEHLNKIANWICTELGPEIPWHLTRFIPKWHLESIPATPVNYLEKLAAQVKAAGLYHVYIGNVANHPLSNTYCPACSTLLIRRENNRIDNRLINGCCPTCGQQIYGTFSPNDKKYFISP